MRIIRNNPEINKIKFQAKVMYKWKFWWNFEKCFLKFDWSGPVEMIFETFEISYIFSIWNATSKFGKLFFETDKNCKGEFLIQLMKTEMLKFLVALLKKSQMFFFDEHLQQITCITEISSFSSLPTKISSECHKQRRDFWSNHLLNSGMSLWSSSRRKSWKNHRSNS